MANHVAITHQTVFRRSEQGCEESWENYVPPYKNLGAIFIKAYNKKMSGE